MIVSKSEELDQTRYYKHLTRTYKDVDPTIFEGYSRHETHVSVNNRDNDLFPIQIDILDLWKRAHREYGIEEPSSFPVENKIEGFGLPRYEQKFQKETIPRKLVELEKDTKKKLKARKKRRRDETYLNLEHTLLNDMWDFLEENKLDFSNEILWLEKMWYFRLTGKWVYINGKPTYIPGWMWYYCNFGTVDDGDVEYRERDRKWFLAFLFSYLDTTTFSKLDDNGWAIPEKNGVYKMIDLGRRVCFGLTDTKGRRVGDTTKAQIVNTELSTREKGMHNGIQGKDSSNAEMVFKEHYVSKVKNLPWFFRPLRERLEPATEMIYNYEDPDLGLETKVDYATTADRSKYDGIRLRFYHRDEPGKVKYEDISASHQTIKNCCSLGSGSVIIGLMIYTTTVEEMDSRGGENYRMLCGGSYYNQRNKNGQTKTGLYNLFIPADEGLAGFIGPYGESIIDTPNKEQAKYIGRQIGAREHLDNERAVFIRDEDWESLNNHKRMFPLSWKEAFTPPIGNVFFNTLGIENRLMELSTMDVPYLEGDFVWKKPFREVEFVIKKGGKWHVSKILNAKQANRMVQRDGVFMPETPDAGVIAADPFGKEKTNNKPGKASKRKGISYGGAVARWSRDLQVDPLEKPMELWDSARIVADYLFRPATQNEYCEDMLMACIYFGYMMYPEMNIDIVARYFRENGFEGYLLYDTDTKTGKKKPNPGWTTNDSSKREIFNAVRDDIELHVHRQRHPRVLKQVYDIAGLEDMTDYDSFTSYGGSLLGERSKYTSYLKDDTQEHDTTNWLPETTI